MREHFLNQLKEILAKIHLGASGELHLDEGSLGESPHSAGLDTPTRLQHWLYQNCFCNRLMAEAESITPPAAGSRGSLLTELSGANNGHDCWDSGWEITEVTGSGQVLAKKQELTRSFWPGEFISLEGPGIPPRAGMRLRAFFPKESATMQPGFYFAFGNPAEEEFEHLGMVRLYWAVRSGGAVALVRSICERLNRFDAPFRLKVPIDGSSYGRLDAAVLYVNKRFYQSTALLLAGVYGVIRSHLTPHTPLFTKPLAPGLGLAEDPGTGESFGMQRCRILGEAIWTAYTSRSQPVQPPLEAVLSQLELSGLRAEYPYLCPGSTDQYDFALEDGVP